MKNAIKIVLFLVVFWGVYGFIIIYHGNQITPEPVVYEVLEKSKLPIRYYNIFYKREIVETKKIMVLLNVKTGHVFTHEADDLTYYKFNKGQRLQVDYPYCEDK